MNYKLAIKGFERQTIEIQSGGLLSAPKLLVGGQPAPAGAKRGEFRLRRDDGKEVTAAWKPQLLGLDVPQLTVDGTVVTAVEPLKWYELLWSVLPLFMIFLGGAIGGLFGALATVINMRIFRSSMPSLGKFAVTGVISVVAVVGYTIVAGVLLASLGRA